MTKKVLIEDIKKLSKEIMKIELKNLNKATWKELRSLKSDLNKDLINLKKEDK